MYQGKNTHLFSPIAGALPSEPMVQVGTTSDLLHDFVVFHGSNSIRLGSKSLLAPVYFFTLQCTDSNDCQGIKSTLTHSRLVLSILRLGSMGNVCYSKFKSSSTG